MSSDFIELAIKLPTDESAITVGSFSINVDEPLLPDAIAVSFRTIYCAEKLNSITAETIPLKIFLIFIITPPPQYAFSCVSELLMRAARSYRTLRSFYSITIIA